MADFSLNRESLTFIFPSIRLDGILWNLRSASGYEYDRGGSELDFQI